MHTHISKALPIQPAKPELTPGVRQLKLQSFSYDNRKTVLTAVAEVLERCGCWVLDRKVVSHTQTELIFEVNGRATVELYSSLVGAGLELTRASHIALTNLCSLMRHGSRFSKSQRLVHVQLEVSFLEEVELKAMLPPAAGLA